MSSDTMTHGVLSGGIRRLLDRHPLLAGIVCQWKSVSSPIGTMGVGWVDDRIVLYYDPIFISSITTHQISQVLMHEVRHVLYGHCQMDPDDWPDGEALMIAQEVTVNEGLDDLPGDPYLLKDYPELPHGSSTRERYHLLAKNDDPKGRKASLGGSCRGSAAEEGESRNKKCESFAEPSRRAADAGGLSKDGNSVEAGDEIAGNDGASCADEGDGSAPGSGNRAQSGGNVVTEGYEGDGEGGPSDSTPCKAGASSVTRNVSEPGSCDKTGGGVSTARDVAAPGTNQNPSGSDSLFSDPHEASSWDHHAGWKEIRDQGYVATLQLDDQIRKAMKSVTDFKEDYEEIGRILEHTKAWSIGGGNAVEKLDDGSRIISIGDLEQEIASRFGSGRTVGHRFDRAPRRNQKMIGIMPAITPMRRQVRALGVIDTSGSMDGPTLALIVATIRRLELIAEWTIVECDNMIHAVYPFTGVIEAVHGRGGTSFFPPLDSAFLTETEAELVVYFTDGIGPAPEEKPEVEVIWALIQNGEPPAPWGLVIKLG